MNIALIRISDPEPGPHWIGTCMPLEMKAIREFESDDGSQYILTELFTPINSPDGEITYLVVGGRIVGRPLTGGVGGTPANVAVVTDKSVLDERKINLDKCEFAAVAVASCIPRPEPISKPSKWWQFWK